MVKASVWSGPVANYWLAKAFVLGASCKTRGLRSLISCLQPLNVSLYQTGAFQSNRSGACSFDDDWVGPLYLDADDNLQCTCLERESHILDCAEDHFLLSQCMIVEWQSDFRTALLFQSEWALSQFRVWLHSCGVRNYTVGLKRQNPLFGLDLATEWNAV